MSLPTSDVEIVNLALDLLGEKPISDIQDPETPMEALCARWYDVTRQALLEGYSWNFANTGEAIPRGGTPTVALYPDYYSFPNDYLKLTSIHDPKYPLSRYNYRIEGKKLLIDNGGESSIDVWFIHDITDIGQYSPLFIYLLAGELALVLAYKINRKGEALTRIKTFVDIYRQRALAANGQARPPRAYESSPIVNIGRNLASQEQVAGPHEFLFDP